MAAISKSGTPAARKSRNRRYSNFVLARYLPNGSPDPSFADHGRTSPYVAQDIQLEPRLLAQDSARRVVVAGGIIDNRNQPARKGLGLVRYLPDGTLDSSFGVGGLVVTSFGWTPPPALAIDTADRILLASDQLANPADPKSGHYAVARYRVDGSLDTTFDGDGSAILGQPGYVSRLALDREGRLLLGGTSGLMRLLPDGTPDPNFPLVKFQLPNTCSPWVNAVAIDQAQRILVAASAFRRPCSRGLDGALFRLTADGAVDTTFGETQPGSTAFAKTNLSLVTVEPGGKILVEVTRSTSQHEGFDRIARFDESGHLDHTFGDDGFASLSIAGQSARAEAIATFPGGSSMILGYVDGQCGRASKLHSCEARAYWRFGRNGRPDRSFGAAGFITQPRVHYCAFAPFRACGVNLNPRQLKSLIRATTTPSVRLGPHEIRLPIRCPKLVETSCRISLSFLDPRTHRSLARRRLLVLSAGSRRLVKIAISPKLRRRFARRPRPTLRQIVEVDEKRVVVSRSVRVVGRSRTP